MTDMRPSIEQACRDAAADLEVIVEHFGTIRGAADALGVSHASVSVWRRKGLPRWWHQAVADLAGRCAPTRLRARDIQPVERGLGDGR